MGPFDRVEDDGGESQYVNVKIIKMGGLPSVYRCYIWQLGFRVISLGSFLFTPWVPKHAMEDKLGHDSVKTFHYTTPAYVRQRFSFGEIMLSLGGLRAYDGHEAGFYLGVVGGSM